MIILSYMVVKDLATAIIFLFLGVTVFIVGMNLMSGGLKKATGKSLKKIFKKTQNSPFACLGIGSGVTALIQSSAATCVLAVGFINAGVMTLYQGVNIMLGSFIGTTVTGILVSLSSFSIGLYLALIAFVGIVMMFFKKEKVKNFGEVLTGFGLVFLGLDLLKSAFTQADINSATQQLFTSVSFPLLLLLIGIVLTALVQSSSAVTGIAIVMVTSGAIPFSSAIYLALGATIGTCITTLIATIGGSINAKRSGFISLVIKVIAALIAIAIIWPLSTPISNFFSTSFGSSGLGLAMFTLIYSVVFFVASMPLVKPLIKVSERVIKDKDLENKKNLLLYIDDRLLNTPDIAVMEVKNEILHMYNLAMLNFRYGYECLVKGDKSNSGSIADTESNIDYINSKITEYLISLSNKVSKEDSKVVGSYFHVINDIERIGDHAYNFFEHSKALEENDLRFSNVAIKEIDVFFDLIMDMSDLTIDIFKDEQYQKLGKLHELENRSDVLAKELSDNHYKRMTANECNGALSDDFATLISELERVADHLTNIGYSVINPTGDEE